MKTRAVAISGLWLFALAKAFYDGLQMPTSSSAIGQMPIEDGEWIFLLFPFLFFLLAAFFQRHKPIAVPLINESVAAKFKLVRANELLVRFNQFLVHLKPCTLFVACCFVLGVTGLLSTHLSTKDVSAYLVSGFFISAGIGLVLAYLLSIIFPPRLQG